MQRSDIYFDSAAAGARPFLDFEWYAIDPRGQVAVLFSAGFAAIPLLVFRDKAAYFSAAAYLESLPARCGHTSPAGHRAADWREADRGLFVYDWTCTAGQYVPGRSYKLMATPERPLLVDELPPAMREWLAPVRFRSQFGAELFPEREFAEVNL